MIVIVLMLSFFAQAQEILSENLFLPILYHPKENVKYVNLNAPKGGSIKLAAKGSTFNFFHPLSPHGISAEGSHRLYATLMMSPLDDQAHSYPYGASRVVISGFKATFTLNTQARFENGASITAQDALYSFERVKDLYPHIEAYIENAQSLVFSRMDRKPLHPREVFELGKIPLVNKDNPHLSSGPYRLKNWKKNRWVIYERVKGWWGESLPKNKGLYNFDYMHYFYFPSDEQAFLAFQKGEYDVRVEERVLSWKKGYQNLESIVQIEPLKAIPHGLNAIFFNTSHPYLHNKKIREALVAAFNFEEINEKMLFKAYKRNYSIYMNPRFGSSLSYPFDLEKARHLLSQEGVSIKNPITLKLFLDKPGSVRLLTFYQKTLKTLGVNIEIRLVDGPTLVMLRKKGLYDLILWYNPPFFVPGPEHLELWPEFKKDIVRMLEAKNLQAFVKLSKALDTKVQKGFYFIPLWYRDRVYIAHHKKLGYPVSEVGQNLIDAWWVKS